MKVLFSIQTHINLLALLLILLLMSGEAIYGQSFALNSPLTIRWNYLSSALTTVSPVSDAEAIYVPLSNGELISLKTTDGLLLWKSEIGGEMLISPSLDDQCVYVASEVNINAKDNGRKNVTGILRALSRANGVTLWAHTFPKPFKGALVINASLIFADSIDGKIYAIDKRTGELRWSAQTTHPASSPILVTGTKLYFGTENSSLISLDQKTGQTLWRYQTPGVLRTPLAVLGDLIYFGTDSGFICSMKGTSGNLIRLWRKRAGTRVQSFNYTQQGILVTTQDNFVMLFTLQHGKRLWKKELPSRLASPPLVAADGALFALIGEETCIALSLFDGRQINTLFVGKDNSALTSPTLANDILLVPTRAGLLAFAASK